MMILSALAGFAGLGKAVTSTNRVEATQTEKERAKLTATEIINYSVALKGAISRLVPGGCTIEQISFEKPPFDGSDFDYVNNNSPNDYFCYVFHPNGADVSPRAPSEDWLDQTHAAKPFYGEIAILNVCLTGFGTDPLSSCGMEGQATSDVILFIPYLRKHVCQALADRLHPNDGIIVDVNDAYMLGSEFDGEFFNTTSIENKLNPGRPLPASGCITGDGTGTMLDENEYAFYSALIAQ